MTRTPTSAGLVVPVRTMGTVVTLDLRADLAPDRLAEVVESATALLERFDADLSLWRDRSWLSRLATGEVDRAECPEYVRVVLDLADHAERLTDGWFSGRWAAPGATSPDPTGLVKGWAASKVSEHLHRSGVPNHLVNAAGDVVLAGRPRAGASAWRVGISDPADSGRVLGAVDLPVGGRWAVATSGPAERGPHIRSPRTGQPASLVAFATVLIDETAFRGSGFPDAGAFADASATALVAAEGEAPGLFDRLRSYGVVAVLQFADGRRIDPEGLLRAADGAVTTSTGSNL